MFIKYWEKLLVKLATFAKDRKLPSKFSLNEEMVIGSYMLFFPATFIWGIMYFLLGEVQAGLIPFSYSIFHTITFILFLRKRSSFIMRMPHQFFALIMPLLLQLSLGGFVNSSAIIIWSFTSPLTALLLRKPKEAVKWFIAFILIMLLGGILNPYFIRENNIPQNINLFLFVMNIMGLLGASFVLLFYMVNQKDKTLKLLHVEQKKSEELILNILPKKIAKVLKNENRLVAEAYTEASILFADLVEFTPLSELLTPIEMVQLLNEIYSHFDNLVDKFGLEKIRTIGDNYMVAAGVPEPKPDHAQALAKMAIDIGKFVATFPLIKGKKLQFRIGINSGPVVAGVVGKKKFQYDVWGDMVNVASRMESQGLPGKIQVTDFTYGLLQDEFDFEHRGDIDIKGKGKMKTWFLLGEKI